MSCTTRLQAASSQHSTCTEACRNIQQHSKSCQCGILLFKRIPHQAQPGGVSLGSHWHNIPTETPSIVHAPPKEYRYIIAATACRSGNGAARPLQWQNCTTRARNHAAARLQGACQNCTQQSLHESQGGQFFAQNRSTAAWVCPGGRPACQSAAIIMRFGAALTQHHSHRRLSKRTSLATCSHDGFLAQGECPLAGLGGHTDTICTNQALAYTSSSTPI